MKRHIEIDIQSVIISTFYLVTYCILLQFESTFSIALVMFIASPLVVAAMVYVILKHGKYRGPQLKNDEFGYADKAKDKLGTF